MSSVFQQLNSLGAYITNIPGYKLSKTHFNFGSKVHSSDFYYAKRLFQNSFFASRIALQISKKIMATNIETGDKILLIGYELYSEILISLVKKFLVERGFENVKHILVVATNKGLDILLDYNDLQASKNFIIVPIASTGSTAMKVESFVK